MTIANRIIHAKYNNLEPWGLLPSEQMKIQIRA